MTSARTTVAWLTVIGIAVWFASQTVSEHPTYAAAACLATLLFSAEFVRRG